MVLPFMEMAEEQQRKAAIKRAPYGDLISSNISQTFSGHKENDRGNYSVDELKGKLVIFKTHVSDLEEHMENRF